MATRITVHASPLTLRRGVRGVAGQPMEIVVHFPTSPALSVHGFDVARAFPTPALLGSLPGMVRAARERPDARLLLFGHTDESGGDAPNKHLSDRRAKAVFALLTQDLAALDAVAREDAWSHSEYQQVLTALGAAGGKEQARSVRIFQRQYNAGAYHRAEARKRAHADLKVDGVLGPRTEAALRDAYLALVPVSLDPARFFGPKTAGCGEFNRKGGAEQDRRVALALYRPDFPTENRIPCKQGDAGSCKILKKARHPWKCNFYRRTIEGESEVTGPTLQHALPVFDSDFALGCSTKLASQLTLDAFALWGRAVFGEDIPRAAFDALHAALRGGSLPNAPIRVVRDLQDHLGAFDSASMSVLLAQELLLTAVDDGAAGATLSAILVEEFGHYLDSLLRTHYSQVGGDGPQDEGARFAVLLLTEQLGAPDRFQVGVLRAGVDASEIFADWGELKRALESAFDPREQALDERAGSLEFSGAGRSGGPAIDESREILYLHLLLAGSSFQDPHALVALARKLEDRWQARSGPAVFYEAQAPGKPAPELERALLRGLLQLYQDLDAKLQAAPLTADGLPDLGSTPAWSSTPPDNLWDPGSPLAGIVDDIVPFGQRDTWMTRLCELAPQREPLRREVRVRYFEFEPEKVPSLLELQTRSQLPAYAPGVSDAANALAGDRTLDATLNVIDRGVAGLDTILELVQIEVLGGMGLALGGMVLGVLTTLSGMLEADKRQAEAAKAVGILQAFFAIKEASKEESPPHVMIVEDVERRTKKETELLKIRHKQIQFRGPTPESVLQEGRRDGIRMVLNALEQALKEEDRRAWKAYENMQLRLRLEYRDDPSIESRASGAYPPQWWKKQIHRAIYVELTDVLAGPAYTVLARLRPR